MQTSQRGSTLVISILVILIMAVIGVGVLRFTSREAAGSSAAAHQEAATSCAEAGRALLVSRFHVLGTAPASLDVLDVKLDGPSGSLRAMGGHIDTHPAATITQVEALDPESVRKGSLGGARDITNMIVDVGGAAGAASALGGVPLKITVHCQEGDASTATSGRQFEIEYAVRFGL
jgi:hypothetical protein